MQSAVPMSRRLYCQSSAVLLRRPDILCAENQLKGANANIGVARAAFFPNIKMAAGIGRISNDLSDLFKAGAGTWGYSPQIEIPIFAAGRIRYGLKVSKLDREIYLEYEKALQSAFREVADALHQQHRHQESARCTAGACRRNICVLQDLRNQVFEGDLK